MPDWAEVRPRVMHGVREFCRQPYPGHKSGCPNHGTRPTCPPQAPYIEDVLDLSAPVYAIWNRFDLAAHVARMRARHPGWTDRQLRCCRYWQPGARRELRGRIREFLEGHRGWAVVACPEACGVNVTATMESIGIMLEWPPIRFAYQVALAGLGADRPEPFRWSKAGHEARKAAEEFPGGSDET